MRHQKVANRIHCLHVISTHCEKKKREAAFRKRNATAAPLTRTREDCSYRAAAMSAIVTYNLGTVDSQAEIAGVQFGIMSADEVRRLAVVECDEVSLYTKSAPTPRGVLDHRMGTVDQRLSCGTCGQDPRNCPGHWGRIELPLPVLHIAFIETVRKVLNCVCYCCSRLRLGASDVADLPVVPDGSTQRKQRLASIYSTCRNRKACPHCSSPCPLVVRTPTGLATEWAHLDPSSFGSAEERGFCTGNSLDPRLALEILQDILEEDLQTLGIDPEGSHPKNMVLTVLLVPPPVIRPSIMVSEGSRARGQDDLTTQLLEIVKRVSGLKETLSDDSPSPQVARTPLSVETLDAWDRLSQDVWAYMHNTPRGNQSSKRSGVPRQCLFSRLSGKTGRFRSNLQGKRVNFSGRSVISPDPLLDVDEVGVPEVMALQLTTQERVGPQNAAALAARVLRGANRIDGAESVITRDGTSIQLKYCCSREQLRLENGWIVERPMQTGDWVIFNRQPTLHRSSMMGHRVQIMPGKTLRCNLAVVSPYNADFDGDEMNVHVPQSPAATAEVRGLMAVTHQVVAPQASRPVMGIVQDALLGAHLMTSPDVLLTAPDFMAIIMAAHRKGDDIAARTQLPPPAFIAPVALWTGKQLIEVLLPRVSLHHGDVEEVWETVTDDASVSTVASHPVIIHNGHFVSGQLNKATMGASTGSLTHHVLLSSGNTRAVEFMGDAQRVVNRWLMEYGFSIGIGDCVPSGPVDTQMRESIDQALRRIDALQEELPRWSSVTLGNTNDSGGTTLEKLAVERTIHSMVSRAQMSTGSMVRKEMRHGNGLGAMVSAGSKGNNINICQIMLCVGQNCVNGNRIGRDGPDDRTLPSYPHGDQSVDGAGFVSNSYLLGLTATESFFHAKGGREGLVDTAVKTSKTGYLQRKLVKGMESHRAEADLSVRDASNNLVEFLYGGDGMDPAKLEPTEVIAYRLSDSQLWQACTPGADCALQADEATRLIGVRDETRRCRLHINTRSIRITLNLPVNPNRVLQLIVSQDPDGDGSPVSKQRVVADVERVIRSLNDALPVHATCNLRLALLYELRTAQVVDRLTLTVGKWEKVVQTVTHRILHALVDAGEMVGCISAQSIGEPATQVAHASRRTRL